MNKPIETQVEFQDNYGNSAVLTLELVNLKQRWIDDIDDDANHIDPSLWTVEACAECPTCRHVFAQADAMEGCQPFQVSDYTYEYSKAILEMWEADPAFYFDLHNHDCK